MNKTLRFILIISLLLNFSVLLSAGYSYYKQSRVTPALICEQPSKGGFPIESVSLRPEQREAIRAKATAFHSEIDAARTKVIRKRMELLAILRSDSSDPQVVKDKLAEIGKLQGEVQKMAANHMLEVKGLLDKDQQNKFFDLIQEAMKSRSPGRMW